MSQWYLAEIVAGLPVQGYEDGHHVYCRLADNGRVQVRAKGGLRAIVTLTEAKRRLRTVRRPDGTPLAVKSQERWSEEWSARTAAA